MEMILSVTLGYVLGCTTMILYLNKKFRNVKELMSDKILVNDLLKKEIENICKCKNSDKPANKNKRRNFRRKPKKQLDK